MQDPASPAFSITLHIEADSPHFDPSFSSLQTRAGARLSEALAGAGVPFVYPCGCSGICGRCRVVFEEGAPKPSEEEKRLLTAAEIAEGVRLACCAVLKQDAKIRLSSLDAVQPGRFPGSRLEADIEMDSGVEAFRCDLPPSTLENPLSDWQRVALALPENRRDAVRPALETLRALPAATKQAEAENQPLVLVLRDNLAMDVECGGDARRYYGLAVDLGTTTIAAEIVDLHSGAEIAFASCLNPQAAFGFDLLCRIHAIQKNPANLDTLHQKTIEAIGGLVETMCREQHIPEKRVCAMALAGNTVMSHLFLGVDPRPLGQAPFAGALRPGVHCEARDLNLPIHPRALVVVFPCLGGFVGGDIVAGVLAARLEQQPGVNVLVDIGTNGEVVVAKKGVLYAASSAAGPAFEGGKIRCGTFARNGAVDGARLEANDFLFSTIGNLPPVGICGSGLIEIFARCVETRLIQPNGRITHPGAASDLPPALAARLQEGGEAGRRIRLFPARGETPEIYLSQADVREFQLAKGAVQTAIAMLLDETQTRPEEINRFFVAGAFGNHLNMQDAAALGLLPDLPREKVFFIGNSALTGTRRALLNRAERLRAERLAEETRSVELASRGEFEERFAAALALAPAMTP